MSLLDAGLSRERTALGRWFCSHADTAPGPLDRLMETTDYDPANDVLILEDGRLIYPERWGMISKLHQGLSRRRRAERTRRSRGAT